MFDVSDSPRVFYDSGTGYQHLGPCLGRFDVGPKVIQKIGHLTNCQRMKIAQQTRARLFPSDSKQKHLYHSGLIARPSK